MREDSNLARNGYIPLDISWTLKMGVLDLVYGGFKGGIKDVLKVQKELPKELEQLSDVVNTWDEDKVPVESEFLYKCLRMASLKKKTRKIIVKAGELENIELDEEKIDRMPLEKLARLDPHNGSWAIAYVLANKLQDGSVNSYPVDLAYTAVKHWTFKKKAKAWTWNSHYDRTILRQAEAFTSIMNRGRINFNFNYPEDYPFARAFEVIRPEDVPSRLSAYVDATETALAEYDKGIQISSDNDRVVQALVMKSKFYEKQAAFKNPDCAKKSWPQFWRFLEDHS